jgi:hypothetical protein
MLLLVLNLAGTFAFGLSGGMAGVRARLDLFGVVVLAVVVGLAGGITRDLLIGVPPATIRDWRYLAVAGGAGLVTVLAHPPQPDWRADRRAGRGRTRALLRHWCEYSTRRRPRRRTRRHPRRDHGHRRRHPP